MNQVNCPVCGMKCVKSGKTKAGSQRWLCKNCKTSLTHKINNESKELQIFLDWLFGKESQSTMSGEGRSFRRKTAKFWDIWAMPPKIAETRDVVFLDGIYLSRKACVLICCDEKHVLGWYLCRYEHAGAWIALMKRIAEPRMVVSDGGTGFAKALKKAWPKAKHQRCVFHVFCQVKRYITSRPNTAAGAELYMLVKDLLKIKSKKESQIWVERFINWIKKYQDFLDEMTIDENGKSRPTHERILKAERSLLKLLKEKTLFTYLDENLKNDFSTPSTNNRIEGGINSRLREMLRNHRGLSIERRIKAVYWWCYMHSPEPLPLSEIIKVMPTEQSITSIYQRMNEKNRLEKSLSIWGDAIVWSDLHNVIERLMAGISHQHVLSYNPEKPRPNGRGFFLMRSVQVFRWFQSVPFR